VGKRKLDNKELQIEERRRFQKKLKRSMSAPLLAKGSSFSCYLQLRQPLSILTTTPTIHTEGGGPYDARKTDLELTKDTKIPGDRADRLNIGLARSNSLEGNEPANSDNRCQNVQKRTVQRPKSAPCFSKNGAVLYEISTDPGFSKSL